MTSFAAAFVATASSFSCPMYLPKTTSAANIVAAAAHLDAESAFTASPGLIAPPAVAYT